MSHRGTVEGDLKCELIDELKVSEYSCSQQWGTNVSSHVYIILVHSCKFSIKC